MDSPTTLPNPIGHVERHVIPPPAAPSGWSQTISLLDRAYRCATMSGGLGSAPECNILLVGPDGAGKTHAVRQLAARHGASVVRVDLADIAASGKRLKEAIGAVLADIPDATHNHQGLARGVMLFDGAYRLPLSGPHAPTSAALLHQLGVFLERRPTMALADALQRPLDLDTRGMVMVVETRGELIYHPTDGYRLAELGAFIEAVGGVETFGVIVPLGGMDERELTEMICTGPDSPIERIKGEWRKAGVELQTDSGALATVLAEMIQGGGYPGLCLRDLRAYLPPAAAIQHKMEA